MNNFEKLIKESLNHYHKYEPNEGFMNDLSEKLLTKAEEKRIKAEKSSFFDKFLMNWNITIAFGSIAVIILISTIFFYAPLRSNFVNSFQNKTKAVVSGVFEITIPQTGYSNPTIFVYNRDLEQSSPLEINSNIKKDSIGMFLPEGSFRVVIVTDGNIQKDLNVFVDKSGEYKITDN